MSADTLFFGGQPVARGERKRISIDIARLYDSTPMALELEIVRGREDGPVLFLCGALHGDEINGTEIIRRVLLENEALASLRGTIVAAPIVNSYGFNAKARYLPDGRDLNRSFPGSPDGSLTARLAWLFIREVVDQCTHGIDLHTGAVNRTNWPQIRGVLNDPVNEAMARSFGVPVILNAPLRPGSIREYCHAKGIPMILYEAGEALRFQRKAIALGVRGVLRTMAGLDMINHADGEPAPEITRVTESYWVRSPESGVLITNKRLGDPVRKGDLLGTMTDAFGRREVAIPAPYDGIIIGATTTPLLNEGDAAYHIARYDDGDAPVL